jgi:tetratricopeptide (TPR) repeat protein
MNRTIILFACIILCALASRATSAQERELAVLVYPFEGSGDPQYAWVAAGISDSVVADLERFKGITVVSDAERRKAVRELELVQSGLLREQSAQLVAKLTGADMIFTGSCQVNGGSVRVIAKLTGVKSQSVERSLKLDGSVQEIFSLQDKIVLGLLGEAQKVALERVKPIVVSDDDANRIAQKVRPTLTAYELYAKGRLAAHTSQKEALALYRQALALEPDYLAALIAAATVAGGSLNLFDEAVSYAERAEIVFQNRSETETARFAAFMITVGLIYDERGKYNKEELPRALGYCEKARTLYDRLGMQNTAAYASMLVNTGIVLGQMGRFDESLDWCTRAGDLYLALGQSDTTNFAATLVDKGYVYQHTRRPKQALDEYNRAKGIYEKLSLGNSAGYATILGNMGLCLMSLFNNKDAQKFLLKSKEIRDAHGLTNFIHYAGLLTNLGLTYFRMGDNDRAMEYFRQSSALYEKLGLADNYGYGENLYNIATALEDKGEKDKAGEYFRKAYDFFVRINYNEPIKEKARGRAEGLGH